MLLFVFSLTERTGFGAKIWRSAQDSVQWSCACTSRSQTCWHFFVGFEPTAKAGSPDACLELALRQANPVQKFGGAHRIRTCGAFQHTRFPSGHNRPLWQRSMHWYNNRLRVNCQINKNISQKISVFPYFYSLI